MIPKRLGRLGTSPIFNILILTCLVIAFSACAPSSYMGYQGRLLDASGNPVNGTRDITFSFYSASDCTGTAVHEETHTGVQITDGLFNVAIGPGSGTGAQPGGSGLDPKIISSSVNIYMGISVGAELVSCQLLMAAPKALNLAAGSFISYLGTATDGRAALNIGAWNGAPALALTTLSTGGNLITGCHDTDVVDVDQCESLVFEVERDGRVRSDQGFSVPASDFADMLPADRDLDAGDVLVINSEGILTRSTQPYQTNIAGVYSTEPGFVGGQPIDSEPEGSIPLALVGVIPVKVVDENGAIQPGDLLTSSSTPGYAMKADGDAPQGSIIGKALSPLGTGTGWIQMLAMLQ